MFLNKFRLVTAMHRNGPLPQVGSFTNTISCKRRLSIVKLKGKPLMKTTYHLALRTLRPRQVVKKNMPSPSQCMGYCKVQILTLLLFNAMYIYYFQNKDSTISLLNHRYSSSSSLLLSPSLSFSKSFSTSSMSSESSPAMPTVRPYASTSPNGAILAAFSNSFSSSSQLNPFVKSRDRPLLIENFSICRDSIRRGEICLQRAVIVSFPLENTLSDGTLDAWIGKISIAREKICGYQF